MTCDVLPTPTTGGGEGKCIHGKNPNICNVCGVTTNTIITVKIPTMTPTTDSGEKILGKYTFEITKGEQGFIVTGTIPDGGGKIITEGNTPQEVFDMMADAYLTALDIPSQETVDIGTPDNNKKSDSVDIPSQECWEKELVDICFEVSKSDKQYKIIYAIMVLFIRTLLTQAKEEEHRISYQEGARVQAEMDAVAIEEAREEAAREEAARETVEDYKKKLLTE
jgi:hypothetical protein